MRRFPSPPGNRRMTCSARSSSEVGLSPARGLHGRAPGNWRPVPVSHAAWWASGRKAHCASLVSCTCTDLFYSTAPATGAGQ